MPRHRQFIVLGLVGFLSLAGCRSVSSSKSSADARKGSDRAASAEAADYSEEAIAQRIEAHARYAAAVLHELNDEPAEAAEDYYRAALADPGNEGLVLEASGRLIRLRKYDQSAELLGQATRQPHVSGALLARLGMVFSLQGKREKAIEACLAAIERSPREIAGYQYLAQIHLQQNKPDEALKVLQQAAAVKDTPAAFLVELAEAFMAFGRTSTNAAFRAGALATLERAAEMSPTEPILLHKLGEGFDALSQPDKAAKFYVKLLERFPNLPGLRESLVRIYLTRNDRTNALQQLEALLRQNPTNPQTYYLLGSILLEERKPKEAADYFRKAMLLNREFEPVYHELAAAQINMNQPREALRTLEEARSRFKPNFICEFYSAMAYSRMKDYTNALKFLTAAEVVARVGASNRLNHVFYFQLGATLERNKRYDEAEAAFRKCLGMAPEFHEAMNYLGYMWADRGHNLQEARELLEKAVQLEPKNGAYLDSLGWLYFRLGRMDDAQRYIEKAIESSEEIDATLYDHLGDIHAAMNRPEKAGEAWRKALTLDSVDDKEPIRKKLQGLESSARSPR